MNKDVFQHITQLDALAALNERLTAEVKRGRLTKEAKMALLLVFDNAWKKEE